MQTDVETVNMALEFPVEDFRERIKHFKTDFMLLKQKVWKVWDIALQENKKIKELIEVCAESKTKLASVEERLKSLIRQQEEYDWEFQSSPL